jgi:hypothetical protein
MYILERNRSSIDFMRTLRDSQTIRAQAQITETKARIDYGDDVVVMMNK